ncbi:MAG: hypothetical protein AABZ58_02670, partial [Chloroflexota bacterium]
MNTLKIAVIATVVVLAIAALGAGFVFAQTPTPPAPWGNGYGMMGGNGGYGMMGNFAQNGDGYAWMNNMHQWMTANGAMHTIVWNGLAEALGLTPDQLSAELASGKTLTQIAEAQGVSQEQLAAVLETSVKAGLDKAVVDGVLTRDQADQMLNYMGGNYGWMISHMGNFNGGFGPGGCHGNFAPQANS